MIDGREAGGGAAAVALKIEEASVDLERATETLGPGIVGRGAPVEGATVDAVDGAGVNAGDAADSEEIAWRGRAAESAVGTKRPSGATNSN